MSFISRYFPAKDINGCRDPKPLMTRWRILSTPWFQVKLHCFHRSDEDREVHDHPWLFISLILWGGYNEVRLRPIYRDLIAGKITGHLPDRAHLEFDDADLERKRYGPGSLLIRPAWWAHRVELLREKSWSLVIVFPKVREWGFYTRRGWLDWRTFHGQAGCADDFAQYSKGRMA